MAGPSWPKGADPELKTLGKQIIAAQQREIAAMRAELAN